MQMTQWIGGETGSIMPLVQDSIRPIVSASYNLVENEVPILFSQFYNNLEPETRTELSHASNSVIVHIDNTIVQYLETDSQLKRFKIVADASFNGKIIRFSYKPNDPQDYFGDERFAINQARTNLIKKYVPLNARLINQIRAAINQIELQLGILQSRWIGGVFTDSFDPLIGSPDDVDNIQSNIIVNQTLRTSGLFEELLLSLYDIADHLNIDISSYNEDFKIRQNQISSLWIESVRTVINDIEAIV